MRLVELALTLGNWGRTPLESGGMKALVEALDRFARQNNIDVFVEVYSEWKRDEAALDLLLGIADESCQLQPIVRLEPRTDRLRSLAAMGVRQVVFEVPVSRILASERYLPAGIERAIVIATDGVRDAALHGIRSEVALVDIARAAKADVLQLIQACERVARARGTLPGYRLVDPNGLAAPFSGGRPPASLAGWVRLLDRTLEIEPERIAVQVSQFGGLALANTLAGAAAGAAPVGSLFGLGMGAGWAATEQILHHLASGCDLREVRECAEVIQPSAPATPPRFPLFDDNSWELPADTTPEALEEKAARFYGRDPKRFGVSPAPLLTPLSGHAGLLHLMHRNNPGKSFVSDDPRSLAISKEFEDEFAAGRQIPVAYRELEPKVRAAGLLE